MGFYLKTWQQLPIWNLPKNYVPKTSISILIPARNEAKNIEKCLRSIMQQGYPKALYEVIVLDDFSTDETVKIAKKFDVKIIELKHFIKASDTQSFKKKAIELGVQQASNELIETTDADVEADKSRLSLLAEKIMDEIAAENDIKEKNFLKLQHVVGQIVSTGFSFKA